ARPITPSASSRRRCLVPWCAARIACSRCRGFKPALSAFVTWRSRCRQLSGPRAGALSLPTIGGRERAVEVLSPDLSEDERRALERSASLLRQAVSVGDAL